MDSSLFLPLLAGCLVALISALGVILLMRPVYAAVCLLVHSLSLAALYALLAAELVAVAQIVIYSGAIVVLFLFVVTLLPAGGVELAPGGNRVVLAVAAAGALLAALAAALAAGAPLLDRPVLVAPLVPLGGVEAVGRSLFGPLIVAFELTAPLLLVAIIGAVTIWRRFEPQTPRAQPPAEVPARRRLVIHR